MTTPAARSHSSAFGIGEFPHAQGAALTRFERSACALASFANGSERTGRLLHGFRTQVVDRVVQTVCRGRIRLFGEHHLHELRPARGVLLASNHRSFFDLFIAASCLHRATELCRRVYFPVRSNFWYDHPLGPVINAFGTGMSMFPPVFRASAKRPVTRLGLDLLSRELQRSGTLVGMHPEGTRNRSANPCELLPPEQSFGRVALLSRGLVVPAFVSGLGNSLLGEWRASFAGADHPIFVVFGSPVNLQELEAANPNSLRAQLEVGRKVLCAIAGLAEEERAERTRLQFEVATRRAPA